MWCWSEGAGWWVIPGVIFILLFWGAIVTLVVWGIKKLTGREDSSKGPTDNRTPLDIAKERYAKGEISQEEFEQIKKNLS
jgi:putative membrane protein